MRSLCLYARAGVISRTTGMRNNALVKAIVLHVLCAFYHYYLLACENRQKLAYLRLVLTYRREGSSGR